MCDWGDTYSTTFLQETEKWPINLKQSEIDSKKTCLTNLSFMISKLNFNPFYHCYKHSVAGLCQYKLYCDTTICCIKTASVVKM